MKIIIYGATHVGFNIASYLSVEQHDVVIIDPSPERVKKANEDLDVKAVVGKGTHPQLLSSIGCSETDCFISVTESDELNMLSCQVAYSLFEVPLKIAHIRNLDYLDPKWAHMYASDHMPIDYVISPEQMLATQLAQSLRVPASVELVELQEGEAILLIFTVLPECPLINTAFHQFTELFPDLPFNTVYLMRDGKAFFPDEDEQLIEGDRAFITLKQTHFQGFLDIAALEQELPERLLILGGGNVGFSFAKRVEKLYPHIEVKIVENNEERAKLVAESLDRAVVIQGSAIDVNVLREAGAESASVIAALMNLDELNILSSLLVNKISSNPKPITLVNHTGYATILLSFGINMIVNPGTVTLTQVLKAIRGEQMKPIYVLKDEQTEIFEAVIKSGNTSLIGESIEKVNDLKKARVACLSRDAKIIIPSSDTVFEEGDVVTIISENSYVPFLEKYFQK